MSIVVYHLSGSTPDCTHFADTQMSEALARCKELRTAGFTHVTMVAELNGQVGTADPGGVVSEGKLPDGNDYKWSKSHRAGAKAQKEIITK